MTWDALLGRKAKGDYYDPTTWEVFLTAGEQLDRIVVDRLDILGLAAAEAELQELPVRHEPSKQWMGWGRYKSAVAKALLRPGTGCMRVNGELVWEYFKGAPSKARGFLRRFLEVDVAEDVLAEMEGIVRVEGSSPTSMRQAKAVTHALTRALVQYNGRSGSRLKQLGFGGVRVEDSRKV